jgi:hypothetical protein
MSYQSTELARNERNTRLEAKAAKVPVDAFIDSSHDAFLNYQNISCERQFLFYFC